MILWPVLSVHGGAGHGQHVVSVEAERPGAAAKKSAPLHKSACAAEDDRKFVAARRRDDPGYFRGRRPRAGGATGRDPGLLRSGSVSARADLSTMPGQVAIRGRTRN